jgi:hypothetical protein
MFSIIGILTTTNLICLYKYYDEYKYKNGYKLKLYDEYKKYDDLLGQYVKSKLELEELAIKMKINDVSDIDKYIDHKCNVCTNEKISIAPYIMSNPIYCCKTCLRCKNCGENKCKKV